MFARLQDVCYLCNCNSFLVGGMGDWADKKITVFKFNINTFYIFTYSLLLSSFASHNIVENCECSADIYEPLQCFTPCNLMRWQMNNTISKVSGKSILHNLCFYALLLIKHHVGYSVYFMWVEFLFFHMWDKFWASGSKSTASGLQL